MLTNVIRILFVIRILVMATENVFHTIKPGNVCVIKAMRDTFANAPRVFKIHAKTMESAFLGIKLTFCAFVTMAGLELTVN